VKAIFLTSKNLICYTLVNICLCGRYIEYSQHVAGNAWLLKEWIIFNLEFWVFATQQHRK